MQVGTVDAALGRRYLQAVWALQHKADLLLALMASLTGGLRVGFRVGLAAACSLPQG